MRPRTNYVRFYPSPYLVLTEQGYTKHYYAGADRVCARLGSGGLDHDSSCISRNEEVSTRVESLFWHGLKLVDAKEFKPEIIKELQLVDIHGKELDWLKNVDIEKLLLRLRISVKPDPWKIHHVIDDLVRERPDDEPEVYFYHSDHLGGASWITDHHGLPVQHLQYLPYGEPYVDQRTSGYSERFRFTGKERDEETGYGYFGARYMDHELMTMWLSVDPMADKYPSISPYAYCAWNPVKLVDPDGREVTITGATGKTYYWYKGSLYTHKSHAKQYKVSDSDLNKIYNKGDKVTYNVTKNLESMYGKKQGKKVLDALSGSGMTFNISSDIPSSGDGGYANKKVKLGTHHGSLTALSHELFHAYQDYKGRNGRSIYNEVEAYIFQAIISGNTEGITSRNGDKKYNSAGGGLVTSFSESDFNYVLSNFRATSVSNSRGTYRKERYEFNPLKLKAKDSLLKDL